MDRAAASSFDEVVSLTRDVREQIAAAAARKAGTAQLAKWREWIEPQWPQSADEAWLVDSLAQTVVCGELAVRMAAGSTAAETSRGTGAESPRRRKDLLEYLRGRFEESLPGGGHGFLAEVLRRVRQIDFQPLLARLAHLVPGDPTIHGYEHFLAAYDPKLRSRRGVYFTPTSVVRFLIASADEVLRRDFGLARGLADATTWESLRQGNSRLPTVERQWEKTAFLRILDPACGTGVFLDEVIRHVHRTLTEHWLGEGRSPADTLRSWSDYVHRQLLPRLIGNEILMAPWSVAQIRLAATLAGTGYRLAPRQHFRLYLTDTLVDPSSCDLLRLAGRRDASSVGHRLPVAADREPVTLVLGNPPYAGISTNRDRWMGRLLRGRGEGMAGRRSYYAVNGQPLGEKKLWLTDDYVKFLRYAQWRIDRAGCGVVAFVTNHGYLENPTFRAMRHSLMETFSDIALVDLHGNVKKRERCPGGEIDQSVFSTEQGMAAGVFSRTPGAAEDAVACRVHRSDLWGPSEDKRRVLETATVNTLPRTRVVPPTSDFVFAERDETFRSEYELGYRLPDIMPQNTTAVVTARDRLVIALSEEELVARIELLRDPGIEDGEIRRRFFKKSRSPQYAAGDTRGWRLSEARARLRCDADWRHHITTCLYRPFDLRHIYWADWMIDWPRTKVMRHLLTGHNVGLIARRQMLPEGECNFFWVTDSITIDGVIRSDNRGSESVFPLYVHGGDSQGRRETANFSEAFVQAAREILPDRPLTPEPASPSLGSPTRWLGYLYAQFHSPSYRSRYADLLRIDFPRVFLTPDAALWDELAELGTRLMALHLGPHSTALSQFRGPAVAGEPRQASLEGDGPVVVAAGHPKYAEQRVWVAPDIRISGVPPEVWSFCVGGHQVCRKWLKDRRRRELRATDVTRYLRLVEAVRETLRIMQRIDHAIEERGGWPTAFAAH